jgi:PKD repeat protein
MRILLPRIVGIATLLVASVYAGAQGPSTVIPRANWRVQYVDSQQSGYEANKSFDGNGSTMWFTQWTPTSALLPHEIQIDIGGVYNLSGFQYLPRQDISWGRIGQYEFYVSMDGVNWGTPVANGTFANDSSLKEISFALTQGHYIRLRALSSLAGSPFSSVAELNLIGSLPHTGWRVQYVDSQQSGYEATKSFDGSGSTMWFTQWTPTSTPLPHEIQIDMGGVFNLSGFQYLPRQDISWGRIGQYEFYVSMDGVNWGIPVATGTFANDSTLKEISFAPTQGHYIRLRALSSLAGSPFASVAELRVTGAYVNSLPRATIESPTADITIHAGESVTFAGSAVDPDNHPPLRYAWSFGSGIPDSTAQNPGAVQFTVPGKYTVSLTVTNNLGLASAVVSRIVTVLTPRELSRTGWRVQYVDSQQPGYEATKSFDGNGSTFWFTQWTPTSTPLPHEIQIDLGAVYNLTGFQYLPRQDISWGRIGQYEFYVSMDGVNWGTPVATGTFANDSSLKEISFAETQGHYIRLRALSSLAGSPFASVAELNLIGSLPRTGWRVQYVDSQQSPNEAYKSFDGNPSTMWFTQWTPTAAPLPHEIQIDLGAVYNLSGFQYLPRQDNSWGRIGQYEFYVSMDGVNWGTPVATGKFADDSSLKEVPFTPAQVHYIRLRALSSLAGSPFASIAELSVTGVYVNALPRATIELPTADVTIYAGESVTFAGSAVDPDNHLPLRYLWTIGAASGIPDSTAQNPGPVQFMVPGKYTVNLTVTNDLGLASAAVSRTVTVLTSTVLPHTGWRVQYVDSQQSGYEATKSFDGDGSTMWFTQWTPTAAPLPHEVQIDIGGVYNLTGFQYLPRQDNSWGRIGQYEFYVSMDGVNWGTPVATGTFANDSMMKEVPFAPTQGHYIRLRAPSSLVGSPFASVAELNLIGIYTGPVATLGPTVLDFGAQLTGTSSPPQVVTLQNTGSWPMQLRGWSVTGEYTIAAVNLLQNSDFLQTTSDPLLPAVNWLSVGTTELHVLPSGLPDGGAAMLHVITSGPGGVYQQFAAFEVGPQTVTESAWVYLNSGSVGIGSGRGSLTTVETSTSTTGQWIQLKLTRETLAVANRFLIAAPASADFFVFEPFVNDYSHNCATTIAPGGNCQFEVEFAPTVVGVSTGKITISDDGAGAPHVLDVGGEGVGASGAIAPTFLNFPDTQVGDVSAPIQVLLKNAGKAPITISATTITNEFAQTSTCVTLQPDATCPITLQFIPSGPGLRSGKLTVQFTNGESASAVIDGNGRIAILGASASEIAFGDVLAGTVATAPALRLANIGFGLPINFSNITSTGPFSISTDCMTILLPGSYCSVNASYSSLGTGPASGVLTVSDDTTGSPHLFPINVDSVLQHTVRIDWVPSVDSDVVGYIVYRGREADGILRPQNSEPITGTSYVDTVLGGSQYIYVVTSLNSKGFESAPSNAAIALVPRP